MNEIADHRDEGEEGENIGFVEADDEGGDSQDDCQDSTVRC